VNKYHSKSRIGHTMNKLINSLLVGFLIGLIPNIYAGTIDPNTPDEKYIEYGKKFDCVLEIMGSYDSEEGLFSASAVAIDSRWVLTAAHVVKDSKFAFLHNEKKKQIIVIDEIICHEDFEKRQFGFADIALCHTTSDIDLEFYPQLYEESNEVDKICAIAGYGKTGTFITGIQGGDKKRRGGSNKIDKIENDLLICSPSISNRTELEFLIGSGDSGGGLFIDGKLAGINSCVTTLDKKPDSTYNDDSGHTRISNFLDWIRQKTQKKRE
jgi:hypothetical protein